MLAAPGAALGSLHMGRVKRCKGFFRKLTLGTNAAYAEGHPLARRPVRTCWNPDGFNARSIHDMTFQTGLSLHTW